MAVIRRLGREESKASTRSRLMRAAATVFARQGFHEATLDQVAEEAGFTKGAVYSNFGSKDELFATLLEERCMGALDELRDVLTQDKPFDERIRDVGRAMAARLAENREWTLLFMEFWARAVRDEGIRARFAEIWGETRRGIADLIEEAYATSGLPAPVSPDLLAASAMALTDGLALQALADAASVTPETVGTALALLFAGARTRMTRTHEGAAS